MDKLTGRLLPGEGRVGSYADLLRWGYRGDRLTPHHIPAHGFMMANVSDYTQGMGIAMMMEHGVPGQGGRHRYTLSSTTCDLQLSPRQALAREIQDIRSIYLYQGLYIPQIRQSLQQAIQLNQHLCLGLFDKLGNGNEDR